MDYYAGINVGIFEAIPSEAKRILEVGCAKGMLGDAVKQRQDCEYWGIEVISAAATEALHRLDKVFEADIESFDLDLLPDQSFDCLIFGDVLEHLQRPEDVLNKLRFKLKPDGILIANIPNIGHWTVLVAILQGQFEYQSNGLLDRTHLTFFTPDSFAKTIWRSGYAVIRQSPTYLQSPPCQAIGELAQKLGLSGEKAFEVASIYQSLFIAKLLPDPIKDKNKRQQLLGPHVGRLKAPSCKNSIVIVTYNSSKTILLCLESIIKTITPDDEIVVVDNNSQDETCQIIRDMQAKCSCIHLVESETNLGFSKGTNTGILASRGEYIIILNPDTEVFEGWLEGLTRHLSSKEIGAVGPVSDNVAERQFVRFHLPKDIELPVSKLQPILTELNAGETENVRLLIGFCMAFRRETLNAIGLLDEDTFLGSDDLEISWRLSCLGYQLVIARDILVIHHQGTSFATLPKCETQEMVQRSDKALLRKLVQYYGSVDLIKSDYIWDSPIFESVLIQNKEFY